MKNRNIHIKIFSAVLAFFSCLFTVSCEKLVDVASPVTSVNKGNVYAADATAAAVMTGIYTKLSSASLTGGGSLSSFMSLFPGLAADELTLANGIQGNYAPYFTNRLSRQVGINTWGQVYSQIYVANAVLEGVAESTTLTPAVAKQLQGEARFMRAFFYFYLVNLYGDVPLVLTTDYKVNMVMARTPRTEVYKQIITDLIEAQKQLSDNFLDASLLRGGSERVRPNYWAATALLARAYLYTGNNAGAESEASKVISKTSLFGLSPLASVFLKASTGNNEAIWQLQPVNQGWNTEDARLFIVRSTGFTNNNPVYLNAALLSSFEPGDSRKSNWVGNVTLNGTNYSYPAKYKINTQNSGVNEYHTILRLSELYLIRAEARANGAGSGFTGGKQDLDAVRSRASLLGTTALNSAELITAIKKERRVEFFAEWGHRWLDLKRWGDIDAVMTLAAPVKNTTWDTDYQYWPISNSELTANRNLLQTKGYK